MVIRIDNFLYYVAIAAQFLDSALFIEQNQMKIINEVNDLLQCLMPMFYIYLRLYYKCFLIIYHRTNV